MERSYKEWQALVAQFKSRIASLKALLESEYEQMEKQKKTSAKVRKANSQNTQKS